MINDERLKLKIKVLLRRRVARESSAERSQSHRIDAPADSDAYRHSEASTEKQRVEGFTNSGLLLKRPIHPAVPDPEAHENIVKLGYADWRRRRDF